jgi:UDP-N-acetylmuramate dehydrogenase
LISVKTLHTFGLDAYAKQLVEISDIDQLVPYVGKKIGDDIVLLGEGSNSVFLQDYDGTLLSVKLLGIQVEHREEDYLISVSAGENWHNFVEFTLNNGMPGLENLALIPGSVGACPIQNIGAYGVEISRFIESVEYFDLMTGGMETIKNDECDFSYRDSAFKRKLSERAVITKVHFSLPKQWKPEIAYGDIATIENVTPQSIFNKVIAIRNAKLPDPNIIGNAGSFFKNPIITNERIAKLQADYPDIPVYTYTAELSKVAAGWLIDRAGLKGLNINGAAVHTKQALVLINESGHADSNSLVRLISQIIDTVKDKFAIELEPEVRMFARTGEVKFTEFLEQQSA